jgi:hypothetical protein
MGVSELKHFEERVVTIFGSSRPREGEPEYFLAYDVGKELATAGFTVCNGGYGGIMQASARGAKNAGGKTIGVITEALGMTKPNEWIDEAITTKTLVDRMMELISRGEAYVILKGGTGTLLELAAVWEFMNKSLMRDRPIVVVGGFWNRVIDTLREELAWEGLDNCTKYVTIVDSPATCASYIKRKLSEEVYVK